MGRELSGAHPEARRAGGVRGYPKGGVIDDTRSQRPSTAVGHAARSLGAHPSMDSRRPARSRPRPLDFQSGVR
jgi:hypothetical protein